MMKKSGLQVLYMMKDNCASCFGLLLGPVDGTNKIKQTWHNH